jgi:hypothetical protein
MTTAELTNRTQEQQQTAGATAVPVSENGHAPLFTEAEHGDLQNRWRNIQGSFVDEPRTAVKQADELVASTIQRLAETFANERSHLEAEWSRGDEVSTEDLRQAFRRYRSFFERLLTI